MVSTARSKSPAKPKVLLSKSPPLSQRTRVKSPARPKSSPKPMLPKIRQTVSPSAAVHWAAGPGLIVLSTFLQLGPKFIVMSSLLVDGRGDTEHIMRKGLAAALVISLGGEMIWTAMVPSGLSLRTAGILLLASTGLSAMHTALAFAGSYGTWSAFLLQTIAGVATIPVNQCTAIWRLSQARSPARWRMVGWLLSVGTGTLGLLLPAAATAVPTIVLSSVFPLGIAVALCIATNEDDGAPQKAARTTAKAAGGEPPGGKVTQQSGDVIVSPLTALHFVMLSVILGTNAEAVNDVRRLR